MAFGMDWRKGVLTFRDAFPAMSSPVHMLTHSNSYTHTVTHNNVDASLGFQESVTWLSLILSGGNFAEPQVQPLRPAVMLERENQETCGSPYAPLPFLLLEIPLKRNHRKRLNLLLKVKYPVTTEEAN